MAQCLRFVLSCVMSVAAALSSASVLCVAWICFEHQQTPIEVRVESPTYIPMPSPTVSPEFSCNCVCPSASSSSVNCPPCPSLSVGLSQGLHWPALYMFIVGLVVGMILTCSSFMMCKCLRIPSSSIESVNVSLPSQVALEDSQVRASLLAPITPSERKQREALLGR